MKWTIRQEKPGDEAAIAAVTAAAFAGKAYADGDEDTLPAKLREAGALVLSLVAVQGKTVIGHLALSPALVGGAKWLGLGPVAVLPDKQGQGVGSALVTTSLSVAQSYGRGGVVLMGDPAFYGRLGFEASGALTYDGKPSKHIQVVTFNGNAADDVSGDVQFHSAFGG